MHAEVLFSNFMAEHNILFLHGCTGCTGCTLLHQTLWGHVPWQQVHLHVCLWSHQDNTNRQAFPCTILTSRSRGTFVIQFLLPSQWWEQRQKLWQDLVHTTAIFQTDHNQLPCHAHLQHRYCSKHNRCSSTTTSHSPTSSPSCPTTAV